MESFTNISQPVNPWNKISTHPLNKMLSFLDSHTSILLPQQQVEDEFEKSEASEKLESLTRMSKAAAELRNVCAQVELLKIEQQYHHVYRVEALQDKLIVVETLVQDLEMAMHNQKQLTEKLQKPYQGQQLELEAKYHSSAVSMFESIASSLDLLQNHLDLIKWHKEHELNRKHMFDSLQDLSTQVKLLHLECEQFLSTQKSPGNVEE